MDDNNHMEPWDWHREDYYCLQNSENTSNFDEDLPYVFGDETTPVKACGDFEYNVNNNESHNMQKETEKCWETSSQVKRRRMLQFNTRDEHHSLCNEEISLECLKLNGKEDSNEDVLTEVSQWLSGPSGNPSASNCEDVVSAEGWLADCFSDAEMQLCPDDLNFSRGNDVHIDVAELCNFTPVSEQKAVQHHITQTPTNIVFKGRKSFIRPPTKLPCSVAYPFAFIKPSGTDGDVTLKEINQRIQCSPTSKPKQTREDPKYPKSAFSGKPVVGKMKIHTEGGKGSITIMRTRG
ncbi:protein XRI1-like [Lotus japonicus]|uniref:protein XRI1-like n=1 Tax=Lotus japonicus TaxID=34305 RepID=UPI00258B8B87|nr:protein XRI1-like [Lotus japonicus]